MVDVFDEVDEQVRSDRFNALLRRAIPYFVGALLLAVAIVLGVWAYGQFSASASGKASEAYAKGLDSLQKQDMTGAFDQFAIAAKGPAGYRALALMQQAAIRLRQNNATQAVSLFDQAAKAAPDLMIGDIARLKAAYVLMDTASLAAISARLTPLTKADHPYHAQAREGLAVAKIAAGQIKPARDDLGVLQLMTDTPETVRQRAGMLIAVIDSGDAASLKTLAAQSLAQPAVAMPPDLGLQAPAAQTGN